MTAAFSSCDSRARVAGVCTALLLVAGCAGTPQPPAPLAVPAPELHLLDSAVLELPAGCRPVAGAVYRSSLVVESDGRVRDATSESGTGCVQEALVRWVESFRYRPVAHPVRTTIDWMGVEAPRGG